MPPLPKDPSSRARRNRVAGARQLQVVEDPTIPDLPDDAEVEWHPLTESWWRDIWSSPMAPEFDGSDIHGLYVLAILVDQFWTSPTSALAGEIRLQRQCFGLTPVDRRRLQWEIERGDAAVKTTTERRNAAKVTPAKKPKTDPRKVLAG